MAHGQIRGDGRGCGGRDAGDGSHRGRSGRRGERVLHGTRPRPRWGRGAPRHGGSLRRDGDGTRRGQHPGSHQGAARRPGMGQGPEVLRGLRLGGRGGVGAGSGHGGQVPETGKRPRQRAGRLWRGSGEEDGKGQRILRRAGFGAGSVAHRNQEGVLQSRAHVPPGQEPGGPDRGGQVSKSGRGLPGAVQPATPGEVRQGGEGRREGGRLDGPDGVFRHGVWLRRV
mmetsp:Transcript_61896/g.121567  ORF Transcript_61896/g.121567 Transcript_61896/m.121567 type:complete len:226 (-) Transcript_61896:1467-2144(-)